jgi:hypothetical protein
MATTKGTFDAIQIHDIAVHCTTCSAVSRQAVILVTPGASAASRCKISEHLRAYHFVVSIVQMSRRSSVHLTLITLEQNKLRSAQNHTLLRSVAMQAWTHCSLPSNVANVTQKNPTETTLSVIAKAGLYWHEDTKCAKIQANEPLDPSPLPPSKPRQRAQDPDKALADSIHRNLTLGSIKKAARRPDAEPLAAINPTTLQQLADLHSQSNPPNVPSPDAHPILLTHKALIKVIKHFPCGAAASPSGLSFVHMKAALSGSRSA